MVVPQEEAQLLKPVMVPPVGAVRIAAVQVNVEPATDELNATFVVPPLQMVCAAADTTGVAFTVTLILVVTEQPNTSVDVKANVWVPADKPVTVKLPVLLLGPVDGF